MFIGVYMYKRYLCSFFIFTSLVFSTLFSPIAYAELPQNIRIGYVPGYGFATELKTAAAHGFLYQLFRRIENYIPNDFTYIPFNSTEEMVEAVKNKEIEIGLPILQRDYFPTEESIFWSHAGTTQVFLVKKGKDYGYYEDPKQINGKTVATYPGNPIEKHLNDYCKENDIQINYVYAKVDDYYAIEADYYLATSFAENFQNFNSVIPLGSHDYFSATLVENKELLSILEVGGRSAIIADPGLLARLELKYSSAQLVRRDLTEEEVSLVKGKTFSVGYVESHIPITYTNDKGEASGIAVEIFDLLAERYGFSVEYHPYSHTSKNRTASQSYDILLSALGDYSSKSKNYRLTEEYHHTALMLVSRKKGLETIIKENKIPRIGMLDYLTVDTQDLYDEYPGVKEKIYYNLNELVYALENDEIDAMLISNTGLIYLNTIYDNEFETFGNSMDLPLVLMISRKLDPRYVNLFNILYDYIDSGDFEETEARQRLNFFPEYTLSDTIKMYKKEIGFASVILLVIYLFIWNFFRTRQRLAVLKALKVDPVTDLMTYPFFENQIKKVLTSPNYNEYVLISLDIDSFKTINNYYTYDKSQEVLKTVALELQSHLSENNAIVTRVFADNFLVLCKSVAPEKLSKILQENISPLVLNVLEEFFSLTFSVGIYPLLDPEEKIHHIVDLANVARQKGKNSHFTTVNVFGQSMHHEHQNRLNVTYRMEKALLDDEFFLVFQPKYSLDSLNIIGAEALVRWKTPNGEMIYPNDFIPIFEENGYINKLDLHVFRKVCSFVKIYEDFFIDKKISVNISSRTMLDQTIVGRLKMIADDFGVNTHMIELEITESAIGDDFAMKKIEDFKAMGFAVSIDDFGAGVSSLNRLGNMKADLLKLDKAFLDSSLVDERGKIVVQDTIIMAKHLHMQVVAEGVETKEQALWLQNLSCDIAQGYYFSKPIEPQAFIEKVKSNATFEMQ